MNIITSEPKVIWNSKAILGEGTLWVPSHNSIYFVDIKKKKILTLNIKTNKKKLLKLIKKLDFLLILKKIFLYLVYNQSLELLI